jgi:hypothetical protein
MNHLYFKNITAKDYKKLIKENMLLKQHIKLLESRLEAHRINPMAEYRRQHTPKIILNRRGSK